MVHSVPGQSRPQDRSRRTRSTKASRSRTSRHALRLVLLSILVALVAIVAPLVFPEAFLTEEQVEQVTRFFESAGLGDTLAQLQGRESSDLSGRSRAGQWDDSSSSQTTVRGGHTNNWAVLVCTSKFWFNYRHIANTLGMYRTVKRLGIPDSNIILMLADDAACNPRNKFPGNVWASTANRLDLYGHNIEVDYRGYEANTLYTRIYSPNVLATGSSAKGQNSYSHGADDDLGVAMIDRFTNFVLEWMEDKNKTSDATMQDLFAAYDPSRIESDPGVRTDLFPWPLTDVKITDFFGGVAQVDLTHQSTDTPFLILTAIIGLAPGACDRAGVVDERHGPSMHLPAGGATSSSESYPAHLCAVPRSEFDASSMVSFEMAGPVRVAAKGAVSNARLEAQSEAYERRNCECGQDDAFAPPAPPPNARALSTCIHRAPGRRASSEVVTHFWGISETFRLVGIHGAIDQIVRPEHRRGARGKTDRQRK
ncbi:hypothetical protein L1887_59208 [Cichorium endivia]|nr:hypothetical protein L1887_59208 [Cichorium endivia]